MLSDGHVTISQSDPSNLSHARRFNAQKVCINAQVACKQPVSLPTGRLLADSGSGLPPDAHTVCAEVRVAPSKRPSDEHREVASVHFACLKSDYLKVTDSC